MPSKRVSLCPRPSLSGGHDSHAETSLKDRERDALAAEKKASNLKIELNDARKTLDRLLATGGSSLADLKGGSRSLKQRSTLMLDEAADERAASESPGECSRANIDWCNRLLT